MHECQGLIKSVTKKCSVLPSYEHIRSASNQYINSTPVGEMVSEISILIHKKNRMEPQLALKIVIPVDNVCLNKI